MKRLLGLVVLFVVLCVSVPSYGENHFLIYNLSGSVKGVNGNEPASISWKGYLVMYLSDAPAILDANMIIYGKDSTKAKVYVELGYKATGATKLTVTPDVHISSKDVVSLVVDIACETSTFDFEGLTIGKASFIDIGLGDKRWVAKSAKGSMLLRGSMLLDPDDYIEGTSAVSSSLWAPATKYVNQNGWTSDMIINTGDSSQKSLTQILEAKGYTDATP
jgi:hypothetical protein